MSKITDLVYFLSSDIRIHKLRLDVRLKDYFLFCQIGIVISFLWLQIISPMWNTQNVYILYQNMLWFQVIPLLMGNLPIFFSYLLRYWNKAGAKVRDNVNG